MSKSYKISISFLIETLIEFYLIKNKLLLTLVTQTENYRPNFNDLKSRVANREHALELSHFFVNYPIQFNFVDKSLFPLEIFEI